MSLNNKSKIGFEEIEALPDNGIGTRWFYERANSENINPNVKSVSLEQNFYQEDKFKVSVSFNQDTEYLRENAMALLKGAGFEPTYKSNGNAQGMSISVENVSQNDLMKSVIALAQTVEKNRSDTYDPVLSKDEAAQIVTEELERLKTTPFNAGLVDIKRDKMSAERMRDLGLTSAVGYIDIDFSGYPLGPIAYMREDGIPNGKFIATRMDISTRMELRDIEAKAMQETLAQAGIKSEIKPNNQLSVSAGADSIARALAEKGMIPAAIGVEASLIAKEMRPDYVAEETRGQAPSVTVAKPAALGR